MPRALLLYHFFAPDPVVSSVHFSQLAEDLVVGGWDVEAWPSNRLRRSPGAVLCGRGRVGAVTVRRCWRPAFSQDSALGRVVNTLALLAHWAGRALTCKAPDVVIVGTDPPLAVLISRAWRLFRPRTRIIHWCFDLYPAAAVAHGALRSRSLADRLLTRLASWGLRGCHAIVDIGPCMRTRLDAMAPGVRKETLIPWALVGQPEPSPPDPVLRNALFGQARAVFLYAGRLGRAYSYAGFLDLARALRGDGAVIAFQGVGEREAEIRAAAPDLDNLRFLPSCSDDDLAARLAAADFHLVSLREGWAGLVVPSKFFSALAVGRPVVYDGPVDSSVAHWTRDLDLGIVLKRDDCVGNAARARQAMSRVARGPGWWLQCWTVGRDRFSRQAIALAWGGLLADLVRHGLSRARTSAET